HSDGWYVPVAFESIVDPTKEVLAGKEAVRAIEGGQRFWRIQSSGVRLTEGVANQLEALVVGAPPQPWNESSNPDWARDELIVALNFYLQHRANPPGKDTEQIR